MFPVEAPPMQVLEKVPVGQTALAARTQPSHRPLLTLRVAPATVPFSVKRAVPEDPVVEVGAPPHLKFLSAYVFSSMPGYIYFSMVPAIPPQIPSSATFWSWKTMF